MERMPVSSSTILSVGYDADFESLEIEFRNRHVYRYYKVPGHVHEGLMDANSLGRFFNLIVRKVCHGRAPRFAGAII